MRISLSLGALAALAAGALLVAPAAAQPYGAHSMLSVTSPPAVKEALFRSAARLRLTTIRVDVELQGIVLTDVWRDWRGFDHYLALSRRYRVRLLGVLMGTPSFLARPVPGVPFAESWRNPPADPACWARYAAEAIARAGRAAVAWEVLNEPDAAFYGTPSEYAAMLVALRRAAPHARLVLAATTGLRARRWLDAARATHAYDAAAVHVRGRLAGLARQLQAWRRMLRVPLWVTEHGYPGDPAYQCDPRYRGGEAAQAAYLRRSLPELTSAGAARVFVTLRDNLAGAWASEGLLGDPPYAPRYKPAAWAVAGLARPA
jgi:hypothetical protein